MNVFRPSRAALVLVSVALLTACADEPRTAPPMTTAGAIPDAGKIYVVVQRGQSLDQIARSFGVPKGDIIAANNLGPPYSVKPGAVLAIPGAATTAIKQATLSPKLDAPAPSAKTERVVAAPAKPRPTKAKPMEGKPTASGVIPLD